MKRNLGRPKGTRDFLPEELYQRKFVIEKLQDVFEKYGYKPLETPAIERWELLEGKLGQEGEQLLFKILRRGTELEQLRLNKRDSVTFTSFNEAVDLALRYDLTLPFCRVVAMNPQLNKPFKRYQIQPVWRADRPQRGRFREFYQCDIDIAGSKSLLADAEVISVLDEALSQFQLGEYKIRINHRELLRALIELSGGGNQFQSIAITLDKIDKIGLEGVKKELRERNIPLEVQKELFSWIDWKGKFKEIEPKLKKKLQDHRDGLNALSQLNELFEYLSKFNLPEEKTPLDLSLVRGLDYYTGPIFEVEVENPPIGSIGAGGRYDNLIERFSGQSTPATGASIGLERLIEVLKDRGTLPSANNSTQLLVTIFNPELVTHSIKFAQEIRRAGFKVETYLDPKAKLQKQIKYASKNSIPVIAILGPDEIERELVIFRTGPKEQISVPRRKSAEKLAQLLEKKETLSNE